MNETLAKSIYLVVQTLRKEDITGILRKLDESQWYPEERLLDEQWRRFKSLISYAYENVPYYQKLFRESGIEPGDIKSRDDLYGIPVLTKDDIRANYKNLVSPNPGLLEKNMTSGSTGEPIKVMRDRLSTGYHRANIFRQRRWFGADIGSFEATFRIINYPYSEIIQTRIKDWILNRTRINESNLSSHNMGSFYKKIQSANPVIFHGYPSLMVKFTDFLIRCGVEPRPFHLNSIITTGEMLYPRQKKILEEFFQAPVVNEYGCTEVGIIAFECPHGGWHVPVESCLVEIIPDLDNELEEGEGRVVVTDLMNRGMPFIRYDVGDISRPGLGKCPCGRGLPTIAAVTGRIGSLIQLPDGRQVHSFIFFNIFKKAEKLTQGSIREFQVYFRPPRKFDIHIVPDGGFNDDVMRYIQERVKGALGHGCELSYDLVDEINYLGNGKFEKFIVLDD